jgi:hypothetical protein
LPGPEVEVSFTSAGSQKISFEDPVNSFFQQVLISVQTGATVTLATPIRFAQSLEVASVGGGGTFDIRPGFVDTRNGDILVSGTDLNVVLGGTINAASLTFAAASTTILQGDMASLALGNDSLAFQKGAHITINATGSLARPGAGCTREAGVTIDGENAAAVKLLNDPLVCTLVEP